VTSGTFTLGTIGRPYALFPLGNARIVRSPTLEGDADLIAVEMRAWEITEFGTTDLFMNGFNLRFVALPASMKKINDCTFCYCESLEFASLIDCTSLESVGKSAFYGCTALREVILPASVVDISNRAFVCSGVRLIDAHRCPTAKFGVLPLAGSLVDEVVTSLPTCKMVSEIGAVMVRGTRCSRFVSAISASIAEVEQSKVMGSLLSVTGASSMSLVWPGWTITSHVQVNLQDLSTISMLEGGSLTIVRPSRVVAVGGKMPVFGSSVCDNVLSLSLCGVQPAALSNVRLGKNVPNIRELLFPAGMTVLPRNICLGLRRLERVVFTGPATLNKIENEAFDTCCSLRSLLLPATVRVIDWRAIHCSGIERKDLLEMPLTKASLLGMTRSIYRLRSACC
jgi:hypothetical protein